MDDIPLPPDILFLEREALGWETEAEIDIETRRLISRIKEETPLGLLAPRLHAEITRITAAIAQARNPAEARKPREDLRSCRLYYSHLCDCYFVPESVRPIFWRATVEDRDPLLCIPKGFNASLLSRTCEIRVADDQRLRTWGLLYFDIERATKDDLWNRVKAMRTAMGSPRKAAIKEERIEMAIAIVGNCVRHKIAIKGLSASLQPGLPAAWDAYITTGEKRKPLIEAVRRVMRNRWGTVPKDDTPIEDALDQLPENLKAPPDPDPLALLAKLREEAKQAQGQLPPQSSG